MVMAAAPASEGAEGRRLTDTCPLSLTWRFVQDLLSTPQHTLLADAQTVVTLQRAQLAHHFGYLVTPSAAEPLKVRLIATAPACFATVMHRHDSIMTGIGIGASLICREQVRLRRTPGR